MINTDIKLHRIKAFLLRHWYEVVATIDRKIDMVFWPTIDLLGYGLLTIYINKLNSYEGLAAAILGGLILWSLVYSIQRDITVSLLDDAWSRNLYNLFSSPLTPVEVVIGALILSLLKAIVTISLLLALTAGLFHFNLLALGPSVILLILNIFLFGWAFGFITSSFILRFGTKVQILAWSLIAILYPISGVLYPLNTLPSILASIGRLFPVSHIFEALRGIILEGINPNTETIVLIFCMNFVYLAIGISLYLVGFKHAKARGWFIHPS
jgi:ABC-2 type transport system permease protein